MFRLVCLFLLAALLGCNATSDLEISLFDDVEDQIVGGHDADILKYPYQVSFRVTGSHICGASILNEYWILTAAHCIDNKYVTSARVVTIRVGSSSVSSGGQIYSAESVAFHPLYNSRTTQHDVGLVRLTRPIQFSDKVKAIPLVAVGSEPVTNAILTVTGWGDLHYQEYDSPDTLQVVDIPVVDRRTCTAAYRRYGNVVDQTMFCAGEAGKDSCQGDSGGPLVSANGQQVGIVSWGINCAAPGLPGVYTNLASRAIRDWVKIKTGF